MGVTATRRSRSRTAAAVGVGALVLLVIGSGIGVPFVLLLVDPLSAATPTSCRGDGGSGPAAPITLLPGGGGERVGATEYGGPGDPTSGTVGASGASLLEHPDSYAELGGTSFQTATAMGGLPYLTPLRITWGGRSAVAYKRDIGLGGGPIDGLPRVIDLWYELAAALHIPYEDGDWSGSVQISRPPATGAGSTLRQTPAPSAVNAAATLAPDAAGSEASSGCAPSGGIGVPVAGGPRAVLAADGQAEAPASAPAAVKGIVAAGNQIVGRPYVYGGGHGLPLDELAPSYDCSSSVEHLLYGGGLLPVDYEGDSTTLEAFGEPGPGRWVTIYASADHVFMYVAGLRWDTHDAAGPGDGSAGIGWHPLVRESEGFVVRHPAGL